MDTMTNRTAVFSLIAAANRIERRLDVQLSNIKGISFSEYQLLDALGSALGGSATRVSLADSVSLTPSGVTRALKPMEKLGFVETIRDERDARRSLAQLTAAGRELLSDAAGVVDDTIVMIDLERLMPAESAEVINRFLDRLSS